MCVCLFLDTEWETAMHNGRSCEEMDELLRRDKNESAAIKRNKLKISSVVV